MEQNVNVNVFLLLQLIGPYILVSHDDTVDSELIYFL
jgi:hypothetical protein